ncbi:CBS domain-containing protein [Panacibacter ginsenosidivorans]|uniref:CBS domain-containing protein n=1 Tax=Panacibacter ginsenosidivorans TaxID=1813871 RepID=A0A5B8VAZ0_9BACT|nr:CBS domain-containing protein [Panacibacter ginsenosidivorans]QEC68614.1 CBS domain-containing protein [Panacibacter ginsenosidivorans]
MLVSQIIESGFPLLTLTDKVVFALQLMDDYDILHLPVISAEEKFVGIVSKDDLLDANEADTLSSIQTHFIVASVFPEEHFLAALKIAGRFDVSIIPVISRSGEITGCIRRKTLIQVLASFLNVEEPGAMVVLEMDKRNFSFGEISRLIETNNAFITQLNTYTENTTGFFIVTIKINRIEISDIIATLQRYDYVVRYYFGEEEYENELKENYDLLMTYLKI